MQYSPPGFQDLVTIITGIDAAEVGVTASPALALEILLEVGLFGYKASPCAFFLLRKLCFMMDGRGVIQR